MIIFLAQLTYLFSVTTNALKSELSTNRLIHLLQENEAQSSPTEISQHISVLKEHARNWRPLVYCWRGGQRSGSMALVMNEIGWPVSVQVAIKPTDGMFREPTKSHSPSNSTHVLAGPTGCGKTKILKRLREHGHQILDLEALARHRGSLLGQEPDKPQPSQKLFESRLFDFVVS